MLRELYISNFALIENISINFDKGLNIVTGSTGVGKSLILGAFNFLLGSRATNEIIREKEKEAIVSGIFMVTNGTILDKLKLVLNSSLEEEFIIQRSLDVSGRNRCKVNNQPITVSNLKEIGELLVNIHGQHEHESLTNPLNQLDILDGFGKCANLRARFSTTFKTAVEKEKFIQSLKEDSKNRERQVDLYRFEINEIEEASLNPDELENLKDERKILLNSEKIESALASCYNTLYDKDDAVIAQLRDVSNELDGIKDIDKSFETMIETCNQSLYQLEDLAMALRHDKDKFDFNPVRLEEIEQRLETIRRLKKKYGDSVNEILSYCEAAKQKLDKLLKESEDLGSTEKDLEKLKCEVFDIGKDITSLRKKTASKLSVLIKEELGDLGIANGRFEVDIDTIKISNNGSVKLEDVTLTGFDTVEFMFSSNPGEKVKPLRKIASGGEISRVMLALKRQLALADSTPVLVFDEIDSNIGGRMGKVIGEKLKMVSQHHQVLCITHLPQIASYADQHLKVNKFVKNDRTSVKIDLLSEKERLEEVAEMIRGDEKTDVTRKQAKEMIDDAKNFCNNLVL